ncbi:MAG: T9SS type A sorting domain-containing protein [Bacteroidota bacterium]
MSIKGILLCLIVLYTSVPSMAQHGTTAAGGNAYSSAGSVSYSVGQVDYIGIDATGGIINQGVQQPYEIFVLKEGGGTSIIIHLYPNPSTDYVVLSVDKPTPDMNYILCDVGGQVLHQQKLNGNETTISLANMQSSCFYVYVYQDKNMIKSFKVIKL